MGLKYLINEVFGNGWRGATDWDAFDYNVLAFGGCWLSDVAIAGMMEPNSSVIDIGCGNGRTIKYLIEAGKALNFNGVDTSQRARSAFRINVGVVAFDDIPARGSYDYAIFNNSIEHIADPDTALRSAARIAQNIIIAVPNTGFILDRFRLMFGGRFCCRTGDHIRFWTIKDLREWVENAGYIIEDIRFLFKSKWDWLTQLWPNMFSNIVVIKIRKGQSW